MRHGNGCGCYWCLVRVAHSLAYRDLQTERSRADHMLVDSNKLYDLRGWLRLCEDNPDGHTEFYRWACHIIFGDEAPGER